MEKWKCDICGEAADYHVCHNNKHKYYCVDHWFDDYVKGLDDACVYVRVYPKISRQSTQKKREVKK